MQLTDHGRQTHKVATIKVQLAQLQRQMDKQLPGTPLPLFPPSTLVLVLNHSLSLRVSRRVSSVVLYSSSSSLNWGRGGGVALGWGQ